MTQCEKMKQEPAEEKAEWWAQRHACFETELTHCVAFVILGCEMVTTNDKSIQRVLFTRFLRKAGDKNYLPNTILAKSIKTHFTLKGILC